MQSSTIRRVDSEVIRAGVVVVREERAQRAKHADILNHRIVKKLSKQGIIPSVGVAVEEIGDGDGPDAVQRALPPAYTPTPGPAKIKKKRRRSSKIINFLLGKKEKIAPTMEQLASVVEASPGAVDDMVPPPSYIEPVERRDSFGVGVFAVGSTIRQLAGGSDWTTLETIENVCIAAGIPRENIDLVFKVAEFDPTGVEWRSFVAVLAATFVGGEGLDAYRVASSMFVEAMCEANDIGSIAHTEVTGALLELASLDPTLEDKDILILCGEADAAARKGGGYISPNGLFKASAARTRLKRNFKHINHHTKLKFTGTGRYGGLGDAAAKSLWKLAPDLDLSYLARIKAKLDTGMKRPRHRKVQSQFKIAADLDLDPLRAAAARVNTQSTHKRSKGKKIQINFKTKKYNVRSKIGTASNGSSARKGKGGKKSAWGATGETNSGAGADSNNARSRKSVAKIQAVSTVISRSTKKLQINHPTKKYNRYNPGGGRAGKIGGGGGGGDAAAALPKVRGGGVAGDASAGDLDAARTVNTISGAGAGADKNAVFRKSVAKVQAVGAVSSTSRSTKKLQINHPTKKYKRYNPARARKGGKAGAAHSGTALFRKSVAKVQAVRRLSAVQITDLASSLRENINL